ncbi:MAG: PEP-CTERM sorting domain-containing protein [Acidobacteria bacterium]|nr:PEP-CTERM sorting domain-containing protein [Acidobacteriota bacterium]
MNNSDMSSLASTLTGAGHTIMPDGAITDGNLGLLNLYWIGEPLSTPTAGELTSLTNWVTGGGILLLLFDSGCGGCVGGNGILTGLGTSMVAGGSATDAALAGGNPATTGGPYNLVGQSLNTSPGTAITGGTALAGSILAYQALGTGHVFAFGDRSDHNVFGNTSATVNGQLFLNIAAMGPSQSVPIGEVPEPATPLLLGVGLVVLAVLRSR